MKKSSLIFFLLFITLLSFYLCKDINTKTNNNINVDKERFMNVVNQAIDNIKKIRIGNNRWNITSYLGANFSSLYYVILHMLNFPIPKEFDLPNFRQILITSQLKDGSWQNVPDKNKQTGDINTSIANYWFLKAYGVDSINSTVLTNARNYILNNGGILKANLMTKAWVALAGEIVWDKFMFKVPLFIFEKGGISYLYNVRDHLAQWVYPHMLSICYLRYFDIQYTHNLGPRFNINELFVHNQQNNNKINNNKFDPEIIQLMSDSQKMDKKIKEDFKNLENHFKNNNHEPSKSVLATVKRMIEIQQPNGSFGGYTVSTLFSILAFTDFNKRFPSNPYRESIENVIIPKGMKFVNKFYLGKFPGNLPYMGILDDGHYWDTILCSNALSEADSSIEMKKYLYSSGDYLWKNGTSKNGGIGFGTGFKYCPDVDDTAEMVTALHRINSTRYNPLLQKATKFIVSMQNSNGGFPAFAKNVEGDFLIRKFAHQFTDSAELFDPGCSDITGHVFEALSVMGYDVNSEPVKKGVHFLKNTQTKQGSWEARWGINHIYGTGAALTGYGKIEGADFKEKWVHNGLEFLANHQNIDGGWGEQPDSYLSENLWGKGVSTPTQTAWALMGLFEGYKKGYTNYGVNIENGIKYLMNSFEKHNGKFFDESCVGTGHRKVLYMQYPSYAITFPLMILGRLRYYLWN